MPAIGIVATDTLTYKVCDDLGMCDTAQVVIHVTVINSVEDITADEIKVYPNPFSNEFTVCSLQFTVEQPVTLSVYDNTGREMTREVVTTSNFKLQTSNWSSGIYFLKMNSDKEIVLKKIVKQ